MAEQVMGLDDNAIVNAVLKSNPNLGECVVKRGKPNKNARYTRLQVTVISPQKEIKLIEKVYNGEDRELFGYNLFHHNTAMIPQIYSIDTSLKTILMEDLNDDYIQGFHFNESGDFGVVVRKNYIALVKAAAKLHATFWENESAFGQAGLDWRHESEENVLAHISGMEKDFLRYRKKEEAGKIPRVWEVFENTLALEKLDYFPTAIRLLKEKYKNVVRERFHTGKNITVIHGDLHPGNTFITKTKDRSVKLIDLQAVRMGLCTEDLAMLIALHIAPDKAQAQPLLDSYYQCLSETVKEYPYETFMDDYKLAIMENMFYPIRLMNGGIYDFSMRDKAIKAFETFVLCDE